MNQQDIINQIYNTATGNGIPATLASLMVGQSGNETGGWTSKFFTQNNNAFGYSCDSSSDWQNGCSIATADNKVAVGNYDSISDSTMEVVDWIKRRLDEGSFPALDTITTADQYAQLLSDNGYYTSGESSYAANISKWVNKVGSLIAQAVNGNPVAAAAVVVVLIGGIWLGIKKGLFKKIKL